MSKIFKALEKAERDKDQEAHGPIPPPPLPLFPMEEESDLRKTTEIRKKIEKIEWKKYFSWRRHRKGDASGGPDFSAIEKGTLAGEQFRKLRTKLIRLKVSEGFQSFLITSTNSNEGKSFIAANLAAAISADLQTSALLMECDLRNPTFYDWFGIENGKGLSDYLKGGEEEEITEYLRNSEIGKMTILPAGSYQGNPAELLGSTRMRELIQKLNSQNPGQILIMDSTPILSTTEPAILSRLADGIILVVRAGVTDREALRQAVEHIEKEKIIGIVLNDLKFMTSAMRSRYFGLNGYNYRYGYGYGYGENAQKSRNLFNK